MNISNLESVKNSYDLYKSSEIKNTSTDSNAFKFELNDALNKNNDKKLKKACVEFESYFLKMILSNMRKTTISEGGLFEKSDAEEIFQDMLDEQICQNIAKSNNSVGLANMLYKQLSQNNTNIKNS